MSKLWDLGGRTKRKERIRGVGGGTTSSSSRTLSETGINYALSKPTTHWPVYAQAGYEATKETNGIHGSNQFKSITGTGRDGAWLRIDLQQSIAISRIKIYGNFPHANRWMALNVKRDESHTYTKVLQPYTAQVPSSPYEYVFNTYTDGNGCETTGKYVEFQVGRWTGLEFQEIEVYGTPYVGSVDCYTGETIPGGGGGLVTDAPTKTPTDAPVTVSILYETIYQ